MADNVKVTITERNGTELGYVEEYALVPSNIPFTDAEFTATDVEEALIEARRADMHASRHIIPAGKLYKVEDEKQSIVNGSLTVTGILTVIGCMVIF